MNESSLNATEIAVGSLLAGNRGGAGGGGGYGAWGGGGGGYSPFASPGSNAVRINRNNEVARGEAMCTREVLDRDINRISAQAEEGRRTSQIDRVNDNITNSEFRESDRLRDIEREMARNASIAAECCCDTQKAIADAAKDAAKCCCDSALQSCRDHADLKALIVSENAETRNQIRGDALSAANAELTALKTQIACGCQCPPQHHPHA